jgi:hypothetical protein
MMAAICSPLDDAGQKAADEQCHCTEDANQSPFVGMLLDRPLNL